MDWTAIEAISSAIGAVGVIVTVAYLAYQIRQNTKSIEGATEHGTVERFRSPGYAAVWAREKFDYPTGFRREMDELQSEAKVVT